MHVYLINKQKIFQFLFNEKYLSLKKDSEKYHIFKNRKLTCPGHFNTIIKKTIADIKAIIEVKETTSIETDTGRSTESECQGGKESLYTVDINLEGVWYICAKPVWLTCFKNPISNLLTKSLLISLSVLLLT